MSKPPETLTEPMEADPSIFDAAEINFLLTSLILPRPIGWISTVSASGIANLAPFSFFNVICAKPPYVMFSSGSDTKDSIVNVRQTGEFVANIVDLELVDQMVASSAAVAPDVDEFDFAGLEKALSVKVRAPRVKRAKAHFECVLRQVVPVGSSTAVFGEVVHIHIDPSIWAAGRVRAELLKPVARLGGSNYATLGEVFSRPTPTINQRGAVLKRET
jgi:flavin reductase (DIM6/NTAB) family NADH-FMN oxidoreductase RutF